MCWGLAAEAGGAWWAWGHSALVVLGILVSSLSGLPWSRGHQLPWGGWNQVHPTWPPGQQVALIESQDPVVLIVDIVGNVLQVLEMGTE